MYYFFTDRLNLIGISHAYGLSFKIFHLAVKIAFRNFDKFFKFGHIIWPILYVTYNMFYIIDYMIYTIEFIYDFYV